MSNLPYDENKYSRLFQKYLASKIETDRLAIAFDEASTNNEQLIGLEFAKSNAKTDRLLKALDKAA